MKETKLDKVSPDTPKYAILSAKSGDTKCSFELTNDPGWVAIKNSLRFPDLPANWGPKAAARMKVNGDIELEKGSAGFYAIRKLKILSSRSTLN